MNTYPEWEKNIRSAQTDRDEKKRQREEEQRKAREAHELELQQIANEKFAFVLSKLLAIPVVLTADGKFEIGAYTFALSSVHEFTMRGGKESYFDGSFRIERAGSVVVYQFVQAPKDGNWSSYQAALADHIDIADKLHAQAEQEKREAAELAKSGETALASYEGMGVFSDDD